MKLRVFLTLAAVSCLGASLATESASAAVPSALATFSKKKKQDDKEKPAERPADKADKKKKGKGKEDEDKPVPGQLKKKIALAPKGLHWGMSNEQISKMYDKVFDDEFVPLYKKVQPGPRMEALDEELATKKALLRRSVVDFGETPTGVDQSALKGEYSYRNKESMSKLTLRTGTTRSFFFFEDRLWKVYDEYKLRKGGALGETFSESLQILTKKLGVAPVVLEADYDAGRSFQEAIWQDGASYIRAINREPDTIAVVYMDKNVQDNLPTYRKNKPADPNATDKDVARVTAPAEAPPEKPAEPAKGKKKKGKK